MDGESVRIGEKCKACRYSRPSRNGCKARCAHPSPVTIYEKDGWRCHSFEPRLVLKPQYYI